MPGTEKPKHRRLKKVQVSLVSLVSQGANLQPALLKAETGAIQIRALAKADLEGLLHTLVYVPNKADAHGDWMGPEDVRYAAHQHMATGAKLDMHHDLVPLAKDKAYPVEHFILQGQDQRFPVIDREGKAVDHKGAWGMIVKLEDPALLALAKDGKLNEVSLYAAGGSYEAVSEDLPLGKAAAGDPLTPPRKQMDETKLAEALAKFLAPMMATLTALTKSVEDLKVEAAKPKPEPKLDPEMESKPKPPKPIKKDADGRPVFDGDATDALALLRYQRALEDFELVKAFDGEMGSAAAVKELTKCQGELAKARRLEDSQLGLPADSFGASLRKQLSGGTNGTPTMNGGGGANGEWMKPTDAKGFKEIMGEADALIKSRYGKVKGEAQDASKKGPA